jgi:excinuclease ABC subunit C
MKNISSIKEIFKGKVGGLSKQVAKNMNLMAEQERFEEAAFYRDQFELLNKNYLFDVRSVEKLKNLDVIGFHVAKKKVQIVILFFRGGYIIDKADLYFESETKHQDIEIYQIISQFYSKKLSIPKKILLPNNFQYVDELKEDLSTASLSKTSIKTARRGKNIRLTELAFQNAKNYIKSNMKSEKEIDLKLDNIKKILGLDNTPRRIECFDISNTQGSNPVGSMITFINGKPNKGLYKRFKVQTQGPNDYAMMEEVVSRRLKRIGQVGWEKPDLILIDGGRGHLNKIYKILNSNISIASIAKPSKSAKIDRIYLPHEKASVDFSNNLEELKILINARDEAHRFAITFHKLKRKEAMFL